MPSRTSGVPLGEATLSRRAYMRNGAVTVVGVMGLSSLLAACGAASGSATLTVVTNDLPPTSDPGDNRILRTLIAAYEQQHKGVKINAINDHYDPQIYFSKAAAPKPQDSVGAAFTAPP